MHTRLMYEGLTCVVRAQHYAQCELLPRGMGVSPDARVPVQYGRQPLPPGISLPQEPAGSEHSLGAVA